MRMRLRPTIAPLFDRALVREAAKTAIKRSGEVSGVYLVVELPEPLSAIEAIRRALRGDVEVFYLGTSCALRNRIRNLSSGLEGTPYRHETADKILAQPDLDRRLQGFFLITVPCGSYDSLERFLLSEHLRVFGTWPPGNARRGGRTSARHRPEWLDWSWAMWGISRPGRSNKS